MKKYLFFIEQPYCLSILRPLQAEITRQGHEVSWFIAGTAVLPSDLEKDEVLLTTVDSVIKYKPIAVFVPGNIVPHFFPGIKVQVFHGLEWKKKGHFIIRGFFDLYCTHGTITTDKFNALSAQHNHHFQVMQTGWPKLDAYLPAKPRDINHQPSILYAPTFSPKLTSVYDLFSPLVMLSQAGAFNITVKFHPLMDKIWVEKFSQAQNTHLTISNNQDLLAAIRQADIVLSDTSSAVTEALLLGKKVVTYKNSQPQSCLIDFNDPALLESKIQESLTPNTTLENDIAAYLDDVHPYNDGQSSLRVLNAVDQTIKNGTRKKPLNLLRKYKIRKKLRYFK